MPEYTVGTLLAMLVVVLAELLWARTGIFRKAQYWLALGIMFAASESHSATAASVLATATDVGIPSQNRTVRFLPPSFAL